MDTRHEQRLIYSSPHRVSQNERDELEEQGHRNSVIAFGVQEKLHFILNHPEYYTIRPIIRAALRRMQGLAFDGYYLGQEEHETLMHTTKKLQHPKSSNQIYTKLHDALLSMSTMIQENEEHWERTRYTGDIRKIHQDVDAVELFANQFRGRLLFYGSARKDPGTPVYDSTRWMSQTLVEGLADEAGNTEKVLTGGGPGIMAAANEGAMLARYNLLKQYGALNGKILAPETQQIVNNLRYSLISLGIRIDLPFEQGWNAYLQGNMTISSFPTRKLGMQMVVSGRCFGDPDDAVSNHSQHPALFSMIPGFGTADENWEALCAMQCRKMRPIPFIPVGQAAVSILNHTLDVMEENGTIDPHDRTLLIPCKNEVVAIERYLEVHNITPNATLKNAMQKRTPMME